MNINDTFQNARDESHDGYTGSRDALGLCLLAVCVVGSIAVFAVLWDYLPMVIV